jgi:hypothetical protein
MPLDVVTSPTVPLTLDDYLVVACPACGHRQDRSRLYLGVFSGTHIRIFVVTLLLAMLGIAMYVLYRGTR